MLATNGNQTQRILERPHLPLRGQPLPAGAIQLRLARRAAAPQTSEPLDLRFRQTKRLLLDLQQLALVGLGSLQLAQLRLQVVGLG